MPRIARIVTVLLFLAVLLAPRPARSLAASQPSSLDGAAQMAVQSGFGDCTPDRPQHNSPAIYRICRPPWWWPNNGDLVIWAHGYVDPALPVQIPEDQLCMDNGLCIPDLVNYLGYNFATTSYATNGLAVLPGIDDVVELVSLYTEEFGVPDHVLIVGASEGGLVTTLAVERYPGVFDGGLATCGPIGNFQKQINYMGDFRVVFDYFFPGLIPGSPVDIPPDLIPLWDGYYHQNVEPVVFGRSNRSPLQQLFKVTKAAYDRGDKLATMQISVEDLLWYDVNSTNNATDVLGGQPFDNTNRVYRGSLDDAALNAGVSRFAADLAAKREIQAHYQTTGILSKPLVTLHTTLDQQVPYWHEALYLQKTKASGAWPTFHEEYPPTQGYGHCMFGTADVLGAFDLLASKAGAGKLDQAKVQALLNALGPDRQIANLGEK
jgi:pimeloyl-ACP methyl ester carboxylesterase